MRQPCTTTLAIRLTIALALASTACARPPIYIRVAGDNDSIRTWQLGEIRPCVTVRVTFTEGVSEEPILNCGTEEEIDNVIDLKKTGLLHSVTQEQRAVLHREPVLAVVVTHPEKDKWRCRKTSDGLNCNGEDLPTPSTNGPSLEERRLATWARNRPDSHDPLRKDLDKMCKDTVKSELEIAAYNRTHPPNDQQSQVTDLRKFLCGGPDGPGEKHTTNKEERKTEAPAK